MVLTTDCGGKYPTRLTLSWKSNEAARSHSRSTASLTAAVEHPEEAPEPDRGARERMGLDRCWVRG